MKKFFICLFLVLISLVFSFSLWSCKKVDPLLNQISELRCDIFNGESENFSLTAYYGFCERPYINDGKVGERFYELVFKLKNKETDNATYTLLLEFNGENFKQDFNKNEKTGILTVSFDVENFDKKQFDVKIQYGAQTQTITLNSIVPENTINYQTALMKLKESQPDLLKAFSNELGYNFEIYQRIIVKNEKPYWYIGLALGENKLKALLIDGFSGEILAIREVL